MYRTDEREDVKEMAFARGNVELAKHFKSSQNNFSTVFSCIFSKIVLKRDIFMLTPIPVLTTPVRCAYTHYI